VVAVYPRMPAVFDTHGDSMTSFFGQGCATVGEMAATARTQQGQRQCHGWTRRGCPLELAAVMHCVAPRGSCLPLLLVETWAAVHQRSRGYRRGQQQIVWIR
jgi:hypothetical protein